MANVLVTGGAGYVGCHVLGPLKEAGHNPVVFDDLSRGFADLVKPHKVPLVVGALADRPLLRQVLADHAIDAIMHFAALAYVGESTEQPDHYYRVNTVDALGLLEEAVAYRPGSPPAVVFSSTCAVFGVPPALPIQELSPRVPINPYGRSKLALEWMLEDLSRQHRFPAVILRYFNAAGADPQNGCGECHSPETHLLPLAIQAGLDGTTLQVNGDDFETVDGTAIRDFIHVRDLANAHIAALDYLIAGGASTDINLGTGRGHSVREVVACVERVGHCRVAMEFGPRRLGDPPALVCDASKARHLLNWIPQHSGLEQIVGDAFAWEHQRQRIAGLARLQSGMAAAACP
ncbi:MAG: UDP-glucose 4-epimerase GalE [Cyanobium sp.]